VYPTEQVDDELVPERTHEPLKVPVLLVVNATVPVGAIFVPLTEVSLTIAVQLETCPVVTEFGEQVIDVEVVRRKTVMTAGLALEPPLWAESPA
jgi:hypothetical protein